MPTTPVTNSAAKVGATVRAELARRGLSQADLSRAIKVAQPQVSKRLRGVIAFDINELTAIARFLEIPLSDLLVGTEDLSQVATAS